MAAQRGGRRRAPQQDVVRDGLVTALAHALDVDPDAIAVSVTLDGKPVPVERLPLSLTVEAPAGEEAEMDEAPEPAPTKKAASARKAATSKKEPDEKDEAESSTTDERPARENASAPVTPQQLDEEAEAAADLLEGLLDAMDLPGDLRISVQDAHAEVEVVGLEEGVLIGRRGQTLDAVQELVRTAMQRRFERRSRVLVDVDGYRARRLEKLLERTDEAVAEALATGDPQRLEPMDSIERRIVHQRVAETEGVMSTSHGREPARRIVIERSGD